MTIVEALKEVMRGAGRALSSREAYDEIVAQGLYQFQAKDPHHVVLMQIRRHCAGVDFPTASPTKHFRLQGDNTYYPLDQPDIQTAGRSQSRQRNSRKKSPSQRSVGKSDFSRLSSIERDLWENHKRYLGTFKQKMLQELKKMTPVAFEAFGREILDG